MSCICVDLLITKPAAPDVCLADSPVMSNDLGASVKRGKDWKYENQDGGASKVGKIIAGGGPGTARVMWPNGQQFNYRIGPAAFDLRYAEPWCGAPAGTPGFSVFRVNFHFVILRAYGFRAQPDIGKRVCRGKHWKWQDQDGGYGQYGVIVSTAGDGWVQVAWDAGLSQAYRIGAEGCYGKSCVRSFQLSCSRALVRFVLCACGHSCDNVRHWPSRPPWQRCVFFSGVCRSRLQPRLGPCCQRGWRCWQAWHYCRHGFKVVTERSCAMGNLASLLVSTSVSLGLWSRDICSHWLSEML